MNIEYMSIPQFIECKSKLIGKVATYDMLIEKMEMSLLAAMDNDGNAVGNISEYEMDDSMMRVRTRFRSINDLTNSMNNLIKLRQMYVNRINGRTMVLRGGNL